MMTLKQIKEELWEIAKFSPMFRGQLLAVIDKKTGQNQGDHWARTIKAAGLRAEDFGAICDEYSLGRRELPNDFAAFIAGLIKECLEIQWAEQERAKLYEAGVGAKKAPWREKSKVPCVVAIQHILTRGPVDAEQLEELVQWGAWDGERPRWLDDDNLEYDE